MEQVKRFLRSLIFNKYDEFANALGYTNWKVAGENTFYIYRLGEDAGWYATELPNNKWQFGMMKDNPHTLSVNLQLGPKQLDNFESYLWKKDYQRITGSPKDLMKMRMSI